MNFSGISGRELDDGLSKSYIKLASQVVISCIHDHFEFITKGYLPHKGIATCETKEDLLYWLKHSNWTKWSMSDPDVVSERIKNNYEFMRVNYKKACKKF